MERESVMEERLRFVARLLEGGDEPAVPRARHRAQDRLQVLDRYKEHGLEALSDRSRRPVRYANQLPGLATTRQPLRPRGVTDVLETLCYRCLRTGHR